MTSTENYKTFNDSKVVNDILCEDLLAFERYAKFDVASIESTQIREAIIKDINTATPCAMFEGSLEEWTEQIKDTNVQDDEVEFGMTTNSNNLNLEIDVDYFDDDEFGMRSDGLGPIPTHLTRQEAQDY